MPTNATLVLLLAALLLAACNRTDDSTTSTGDPADTGVQGAPAAASTASMATPAPGTDPAAMPAATPADAVPLVIAIDQHEIDAAAVAKEKATRQDVKDYALMLEAEHRANLAEAKALPGAAPGMDSAAVSAQKSKGDASLAALRAADAASFDAAYLQAMITGHDDALVLIDSLVPGTGDPAVRAFLEKTRAAVANHAEQARTLAGAQP